MAPIIGVAHVAYIPNKKVVGKQISENSRDIFQKTSNSRKTYNADR